MNQHTLHWVVIIYIYFLCHLSPNYTQNTVQAVTCSNNRCCVGLGITYLCSRTSLAHGLETLVQIQAGNMCKRHADTGAVQAQVASSALPDTGFIDLSMVGTLQT